MEQWLALRECGGDGPIFDLGPEVGLYQPGGIGDLAGFERHLGDPRPTRRIGGGDEDLDGGGGSGEDQHQACCGDGEQPGDQQPAIDDQAAGCSHRGSTPTTCSRLKKCRPIPVTSSM